jgi:hypothetical protein
MSVRSPRSCARLAGVLGSAVVALALAACADGPFGPARSPASARPPPELNASDWSRTPEKVIAKPRSSERLVWAGSVERFNYRKMGDQIESEFIFRHLAFRGPGSAAVMSRPVPVERGGEGYFVVRYRDPASQSKAEQVRADLEVHHPQFVLAGGSFDSVIELDGRKMVLLTDPWFETGPEMVSFPP